MDRQPIQSDTKAPAQAGAFLSIGALARQTGIAADTLRVWERRYGRPVAVRLPSGHRRYSEALVPWLRQVAEALTRGHRPARVLAAGEEALARLLASDETRETAIDVERVLGRLTAFDRAGVVAQLEDAWRRLGPTSFLEEGVVPLLHAVGRGWVEGRFHIRHEHYLTEVVEDVLRGLRSALPAPREDAPLVVLATLPGESHTLGLQMSALLARLAGVACVLLGAHVPPDEIARTAAESGAGGVAIGVSLANGGVDVDRMLAELRDLLPEQIRLLAGGEGVRNARRGPRGVDHVEGLAGFEAWLEGLAGRAVR